MKLGNSKRLKIERTGNVGVVRTCQWCAREHKERQRREVQQTVGLYNSEIRFLVEELKNGSHLR